MKIFIFGSTGDLIRRKVLPALQSLRKNDLEIFALGRRELTNEIYRDFYCKECSENFKKRLKYKRISFEKEKISKSCHDLFDRDKKNFIYISMPPNLIELILISMVKFKRQGFKLSVLIEKPFGNNFEESKKLKKLIDENKLDVLLADHYMFKKNVINLKKTNFKFLKITSIEEIGIEGRKYYDKIGALKDMVHSHFFNIIFKLVEPEEFSSFKTLDYKRAQYKKGIGGKGYNEEIGKKSETETCVKLKIKTKSKEFEFITGKGSNKKISFIKIDDQKIEIDTKGENPYILMFSDFFEGKRKSFPKIKNALFAWKIIEKINTKVPPLIFYPRGSSFEDIKETKY